MITALIFHGVGGNAQENWFPWLKSELTNAGMNVVVPDFPHADRPEFAEWKEKFEDMHSLDSESILIGHSLGAAFALRLLEESPTPIRATFLVSPVWKKPENKFAPLLVSFTDQPFNFDAIQRNGGTMHVLYSDNDPYLQKSYIEELQVVSLRRCAATLIPNGGHLNASAGFRTFPLLRDLVLKTSS